MYGVNKVILIGTAITKPRLKYRKDVAICKFDLQTKEAVRMPNGKWGHKRRKHSIVSYGHLAEQCIDNVGKGITYLVDGSLDYSINQAQRRVAIVRAALIQPLQTAYYQPGNDDYGTKVVVERHSDTAAEEATSPDKPSA